MLRSFAGVAARSARYIGLAGLFAKDRRADEAPLTQDELALLRLAKELIGTGWLPHESTRALWAGAGTGRVCALCYEPVVSEEIEYQIVERGGRRFQFHMRCHDVWQLALSDRS